MSYANGATEKWMLDATGSEVMIEPLVAWFLPECAYMTELRLRVLEVAEYEFKDATKLSFLLKTTDGRLIRMPAYCFRPAVH